MSNYPDELYRGVSTPNDITKEGYATAAIFKFPDYEPELRDDDGFCEVSVNWNDDEGALRTLLDWHKPGNEQKQFRAGYCIIQRTVLQLVLKQYMDENHFGYERRPVEPMVENDYQSNPYHGNLLMKNDISTQIKKNIQHVLATLAGSVIRRAE